MVSALPSSARLTLIRSCAPHVRSSVAVGSPTQKVWGGHSNGERACDACGSVVVRDQWLMEVATFAGDPPLQLHFKCFAVWEQERRESQS